jgi:selenocysteine lyase/cysteine desulfurase
MTRHGKLGSDTLNMLVMNSVIRSARSRSRVIRRNPETGKPAVDYIRKTLEFGAHAITARVGLMHYNNTSEVDNFLSGLRETVEC